MISFFTTLGNYDYGFYWYHYLDGTIELQVKATGVVFTAAYPGPGRTENPYAAELAPGLGAPFHQHLFCARLHMQVDGDENTVIEKNVCRRPIGQGIRGAMRGRFLKPHCARKAKRNGWQIARPDGHGASAIPTSATPSESRWPTVCIPKAIRSFSPPTSHRSRVGRPSPPNTYGSLRSRSPSAIRRATTSTSTRGGAGLPSFTAGDRCVENTALVVWHTFGLTHTPRPEDWPIMPVDYTGFVLKPSGFFDRNPTLDVPASDSHCVGHPPV